MHRFLTVWAVLLGGALGAVLRFLLSSGVNAILPKNYPWGIWVVNVLGCFVMGVVVVCLAQKCVMHTAVRAFLVLGVLGGFTTFSSFALDAVVLFQSGEAMKAFAYVFSSVVFCLLATALGMGFTKIFLS